MVTTAPRAWRSIIDSIRYLASVAHPSSVSSGHTPSADEAAYIITLIALEHMAASPAPASPSRFAEAAFKVDQSELGLRLVRAIETHGEEAVRRKLIEAAGVLFAIAGGAP